MTCENPFQLNLSYDSIKLELENISLFQMFFPLTYLFHWLLAKIFVALFWLGFLWSYQKED